MLLSHSSRVTYFQHWLLRITLKTRKCFFFENDEQHKKPIGKFLLSFSPQLKRQEKLQKSQCFSENEKENCGCFYINNNDCNSVELITNNSKVLTGISPLSANPTKMSNTLKQFVGNLPTTCLIVFLTILWGWRIKNDIKNIIDQVK